MEIFDYSVLELHQARARHLMAQGVDPLTEKMTAGMAERLRDIRRRFASATLISPHEQAPLAGTITHLDPLVGGRAGILPLEPASCEAFLSINHLHGVNDVPGFLIQARRALMPDGLFMAAFIGGDTLAELRHVLLETEMTLCGGVSPRVAPMLGVPEAAALMQRAGFALPVVDYDRITVTYAHLADLVRDLRACGQTSAVIQRDKRIVPRDFWTHADARYRALYSVDNATRLVVTLDVVWLQGWAPDASQPQPKKPGSATVRLADALGSHELPAGDTTPRRREP